VNEIEYTCRQYVTVDLLLYHTNESRAETYNTSVFIYLTKYVVFEQLVSTNFTGAPPNVTNMTDNQAVSITVSRLALSAFLTTDTSLYEW